MDGKGNRSTRVVSADRAHEICRFVQVIVVFFFLRATTYSDAVLLEG